MKYSVSSIILSILLLCRDINSFSTRQKGLFQTSKFSSKSSRYRYIPVDRRRDGFPFTFTTKNIQSTKTTTSTTSLSLTVTGATSPVAAITGALLGGALHAVAGPDHLAALLPKCCGQRWYNAGRIGILWGMGHGVSVTILGVLGYALKSQLSKAPGAKTLLTGASQLMEIAVGLSLIVIGAMGLREAREWGEEMEALPTHSLSAAVSPAEANNSNSNSGNRAVLFNGLLHGFSWDGAPSLAPALAVASWGGNLAFLSAYAAGTVGVMAIATSLIGEGTRRVGRVFNRPDLPQKLSFFSSLLAIAIGGIWCGLSIK